jgi:hypothetical protein
MPKNPFDTETDDNLGGKLPKAFRLAEAPMVSPQHPDDPAFRHPNRPDHPFRSRSQRRRKRESRPDPWEASRLASAVKQWPNPPAAVKAAGDALTEAASRLAAATESLLELDDDLADDAARARAEMLAAARSGADSAPRVQRIDGEFETAKRKAAHEAARGDALAVHVEYRQALKAALPKWRAELAKSIAPNREKAVKALKAMRRGVAEFASTIDSIREMDSASDGHARNPLRVDKPDRLAKVLASDDPEVNLDCLADGPERSPSEKREAAARQQADDLEAFLKTGKLPGVTTR